MSAPVLEPSVRELFRRQGIADEIVSVRNALANHHEGLTIGLRAAHRRFLQPASGKGYDRGCSPRAEVTVGPITAPSDFGELFWVVPSWVPVHDHETRTVEGILTKSLITHTDFPLRPWHTYYDWNFHVQLDRQYTYLVSEHQQLCIDPDGHKVLCTDLPRETPKVPEGYSIENEWDTAYLPSWAWPQDGDRVWMVGRWIYDCGHPGYNERPDIEQHRHKTELHPVKALASFRTEAVHFEGNRGPTRANNAVLYVGRNGGYWRQPINDRDYAFDLYLPPRPYPEATPRWRVAPRTGALPVQPRIAPFPAEAPRALRVVVPLAGVEPHPEEYGAIISAGWSDPRGTEAAAIQRVRVRVERIHMDVGYDETPDEWHIYVGVNGRWKVWTDIGGWSEDLNFPVELDLHPTDRIHVTACGFEADLLHDHMGQPSPYTWAQISDPRLTQEQRLNIVNALVGLLADSYGDENDQIGYFFEWHEPGDRRTVTKPSDKGDYRLQYTIESR